MILAPGPLFTHLVINQATLKPTTAYWIQTT